MKNKGTLLKALTCLLLIPCFVIPFVSVFNVQTITGNTTTTGNGFGIFADYNDLADTFKTIYNKELANLWMVLTSIMVVALAVLALCYVVMFVLELTNVKIKSLPKLQKLVSFLVLICASVAFVSAIIAVSTNQVTGQLLGTTVKLVFAVGSWLLIAPAVAGVVGLLSPQNKAKKSKKK